MKVLIITGDKKFATSERFALQAAQVEQLEAVYWGRGAVWPKIPPGQFDVVTAQDPFWRGHLAGHIAWFKGAKLNIQVHTDLRAQSWLRRLFARIQLRHADSIRVVSEKIKKQVERLGARAPITVLPVYIDISKFKSIVQQPHDAKIVLWVGRFEQEKDPMLALEVIKKIPGAKLIMLGTGSLEAVIKTKAKGLPVELPGWQDPAGYLARADVVLCTSRHESWGASIIEALAAGVPVVAPDVGIAREAGAVIKVRSDLALGVAEILQNGVRGQLHLQLLNKEEWAKAWRESL